MKVAGETSTTIGGTVRSASSLVESWRKKLPQSSPAAAVVAGSEEDKHVRVLEGVRVDIFIHHEVAETRSAPGVRVDARSSVVGRRKEVGVEVRRGEDDGVQVVVVRELRSIKNAGRERMQIGVRRAFGVGVGDLTCPRQWNARTRSQGAAS